MRDSTFGDPAGLSDGSSYEGGPKVSDVIRLVRDIALRDQQIWNRPGDVAVIAAWGLVGAIVAARRFRWEPHDG